MATNNNGSFKPIEIIPTEEKGSQNPHLKKEGKSKANPRIRGRVENKHTWQRPSTKAKAQEGQVSEDEAMVELLRREVEIEKSLTVSAMINCKMQKGSTIGFHLMQIEGYLQHLRKLGYPIHEHVYVFTVLQSLSEEYKDFVIKYLNGEREGSMAELREMLLEVEPEIRMNRDMVAGMGKLPWIGKKKGKKDKKGTRNPNECLQCKKQGHWKIKCPELIGDVASCST